MSAPLVYLLGPISGTSYKAARLGWRQKAATMLLPEIECLSPMRGDLGLEGVRSIKSNGSDYRTGDPYGSPAMVNRRDLNDCRRCEAALLNTTAAARKPSIGSAIELGALWSFNRPVVAVGPASCPLINHLMARDILWAHLLDLEAGVEMIRHLVLPGV